jgi:hypothetical protein
MLTQDTLFVEITGVFGAGYVPRLLDDLKQRLERGFRRRTSDGARKLNVLYCIDNTRAEKGDLRYRNQMNELIQRGGKLEVAERDELIRGLHWVDGLVIDFVQRVRRPVDVVLRRGGVMQAFALIRDEAWRRINADRKPQPKVSIFITATPDVIEATYADPEFRKQLEARLASYCETPADALKLQQEWWDNLADLPGVFRIERTSVEPHTLVESLVRAMQQGFRVCGRDVVPWRRVFISYSTADSEFVVRLRDSLQRYDIDCWFAPESMRIADPYRETFAREIGDRDAVIVVVSKSSLSSDWVKFEVTTALAYEQAAARTLVFPVRIDDEILSTAEAWAVPIRERHTANFVGWRDPAEFARALARLLQDLLDQERRGSSDSRFTAH